MIIIDQSYNHIDMYFGSVTGIARAVVQYDRSRGRHL